MQYAPTGNGKTGVCNPIWDSYLRYAKGCNAIIFSYVTNAMICYFNGAVNNIGGLPSDASPSAGSGHRQTGCGKINRLHDFVKGSRTGEAILYLCESRLRQLDASTLHPPYKAVSFAALRFSFLQKVLR